MIETKGNRTMENELNRSFPEEPCLWCKGTELDIWPTRNGKYQCGCYGCRSMGPAKDSRVDAIAAWNARAGGEGDVFAKVRYLLKGLEQFADNLQDDSGICPLCGSGPGHDDKCYIFEIRHVLAALNPAPAIDTGEVERLVDAVGKAAVKNNKAFESAEEMHEWLDDIGAIFSAYDALAAVRKGVGHE